MLRLIKTFFDGRIHHHDIVLFSSFAYILCAMFLGNRDKFVIAFLLLVFLTSIFYHSYPKNALFRLADWIASLTFIFYIINFILKNNLIYALNLKLLIALGIFSLICFFISFFAFIKNHGRIYNVTHTLWHLSSSAIIYIVVFSI